MTASSGSAAGAVEGPRRAAVLGSPIAHSLSPVLHRAAYRALGLDWTYDAVEVTETGLAAFLDSLDDRWAGLSLTMPLKRAVLPLLDEVSDLAATVEAANTVVLRGGRRVGDNTDVAGMVAALRHAGLTDAPRSASVLGGGATARSALAALSALGAEVVQAFLRRPAAGDDLLALGERLDLAVEVRPWPDAAAALDADVVVSTVPGGAADGLAVGLVDGLADAPAGGGAGGPAGVLLDVAYQPWPTGLATAWGARVASGRDLLLWQAVGQVRLMTGLEPPVAAMRAALDAVA